MEKKDISSTKIRRYVKAGKPVKRFVPRGVALYIERRKLFKN